jgi:hypothetical protein
LLPKLHLEKDLLWQLQHKTNKYTNNELRYSVSNKYLLT